MTFMKFTIIATAKQQLICINNIEVLGSKCKLAFRNHKMSCTPPPEKPAQFT